MVFEVLTLQWALDVAKGSCEESPDQGEVQSLCGFRAENPVPLQTQISCLFSALAAFELLVWRDLWPQMQCVYEYQVLTCRGDLANLLVLSSCPHLPQEHFWEAEGEEGKLHQGTVFRFTVGRNYARITTQISSLHKDVFCLAADVLIALLLSVALIKKKSFSLVSIKHVGNLEHILHSVRCLAS